MWVSVINLPKTIAENPSDRTRTLHDGQGLITTAAIDNNSPISIKYLTYIMKSGD